MINKVSYRIFALTLAILMFFTSTGFSMDLHYCNGHLKSLNVFGEAKTCHEKQAKCPMHKQMMSDNDCCSNQIIEIEPLDTEFNLAADVQLTEIETEFITAFFFNFVSTSPALTKERVDRVLKPVQIVSRDIYVRNESFLL